MSAMRLLVFLLLGLTVLAACDSPTAVPSHPVGVVFLRQDGSEAARFVYGEGTTGSVSVGVGETAIYTLRVVDEDGQVRALDGAVYSARNPGVILALLAAIRIEDSDQLVLEGIRADQTTIYFQLFHGQHEEFPVSGVPLVIE
ncbi:MAG: hypothetical protein WD737_06460 [Gemmatimonadota bacterium]